MDGEWPIGEMREKHDDLVQHHRASFWAVVTNYGYVLFVGRFFCKSIAIRVEIEFTNFYETQIRIVLLSNNICYN